METIQLENFALVVSGINTLDVKPWPLTLAASLGRLIVPEGHVLIRVKATGICGSDIHFWKEGSCGPDVFESPFVIGHECAGEIIDVGAGVSDWTRGDRAAIKPAGSCWKCDDCTSGAFNLCPNIQHYGVPGCDGSACTFKVVPHHQLARLSSDISWWEAGAIQPLAIAIQMSRQAGSFVNKTVIILGGGTIGMYLGKIAKCYGATKVVVVERERHRALFAKEFVADEVFVSPKAKAGETTDELSQRLAQEILESVSGLKRGFDVVIEASGAEMCMNTGIRVARPNGTYVQVGVYGGDHPRLPMTLIMSKQLTVRGTFRYTTGCFEEAISLVERGLVPIKDIISHAYHLNDSVEAFEAVLKAEDKQGKKCLKIVILHEEEEVKKFNERATLKSGVSSGI